MAFQFLPFLLNAGKILGTAALTAAGQNIGSRMFAPESPPMQSAPGGFQFPGGGGMDPPYRNQFLGDLTRSILDQIGERRRKKAPYVPVPQLPSIIPTNDPNEWWQQAGGVGYGGR